MVLLIEAPPIAATLLISAQVMQLIVVGASVVSSVGVGVDRREKERRMEEVAGRE
jgi:hypothetical protein